jgi:hypothetical protein
MRTQSEQPVRSNQLKVWTLMVATFIVSVLLAFGLWAESERVLMGFGNVAAGAFPTSWVLAIEYGVLITMVAAFIRADQVDALFSSRETVTWLGGICLFTAGLYHDHHNKYGYWAASVNGYGTFTEFLRKPGPANLPLLLSVWPMAYGVIVVSTSFVATMGWKRPFLRWRWLLHALFLTAVTTTWIMFVLWPWNLKGNTRWLAGSLVVLPALVTTLFLVRDPDRKIHWMNLIAVVWLLTDSYPRLGSFRWMGHGFPMLVLATLLMMIGSIASLFSPLANKRSGGSVASAYPPKTGGQARAGTVQGG